MIKLLTAIIFPVCFLVGTTLAQPPEKLNVGVILPISGESVSLGEALRNGITLGTEHISQAARSRIEITYEDDQMAAKNAISAFNKLVYDGKLDVLINLSSGTAKALSPLAEEKQIPFIAIASDRKVSEGKKYVFNFLMTPEEEAKVAIPEALKRGYKKIARIVSTQDGMLAIKSAFDKINNGRIEVVLDEEYPIEIKDFRTFIAKIHSRNDIDAIMLILIPGHCGLFAKQVRELGIKKGLFGFQMFEDKKEVEASNNALVGQWYVNADDADGKFVEEYRKRFPNASLWGAASGHDAVLLLGAAIDKDYSKKNFHSYLATLKDFSGALGVYSATGDNRFSLPAAVKVVTADGFEKLYK